MKERVERIEQQLNLINVALAKEIAQLQTSETQLTEDIQAFCAKISQLIESTERSYRFEQVRRKIAQDILSLL